MRTTLPNPAPPIGAPMLVPETVPPPGEMPRVTLADLFTQLHSSALGLTGQEAARRLAASGANDPTPVRRHALLRQLVGAAANPLNIVLVIASSVSAVLGEPVNAVIIIVMVLLSIGVNF